MTSPLLRLYGEVDHATAELLRRWPSAHCDEGCADCCRSYPPLVSREEADLVRAAVEALPEATRTHVRARARELALGMLGGKEPQFVCPLLLDVDGAGRCAVYDARPYACRTFGHTSRTPYDDTTPEPFTCAKLAPRVARAPLPTVPFRGDALHKLAGIDVVTDSYLPVWVGMEPDEWETLETGAQTRVVVARPRR